MGTKKSSSDSKLSNLEEIKKIVKKNKERDKKNKKNGVSKLERKVLIERCYNGRSISPFFIQRVKTFYPDIHSVLDRKEIQMENDLVEVLKKFQIYATTKTDKRSLPYREQIVVKLGVDVDMGAMFEYEETYRDILKELLNKDARKIRFYVHTETFQEDEMPWLRCGVKYCFRYFIH